MAAITVTKKIPEALRTIARATTNGKLDVGYQCSDSHPYFRFNLVDVLYTRHHPNNVKKSVTVTVYEKTTKVVDGVTYDAMEQVGTGVQNGSSLTYGGDTYTADGTFLNIREHKVNKWSECKPILATGREDIDFNNIGSREAAGHYFGLFVPGSPQEWADSGKDAYAYTGIPVLPASAEMPCRLMDFNGYDPLAVCTLTAKVEHVYNNIIINNSPRNSFSVTIKHPSTPEGSIDFDEIITRMGSSVNIANRYPVVSLIVPVRTLNVMTGEVTVTERAFTSRLYIHLASHAFVKQSEDISRKYYADMDALVTFLSDNYEAVLPNNYRAAVWLVEDISAVPYDGWGTAGYTLSPDFGTKEILANPVNYIKWRDALYDFGYISGDYTSSGNIATFNLVFMAKGETTEGYDYYMRYKIAGTDTSWNSNVPFKSAVSTIANNEVMFVRTLTTLPSSLTIEYEIYGFKPNYEGAIIGTQHVLLKGTTTLTKA